MGGAGGGEKKGRCKKKKSGDYYDWRSKKLGAYREGFPGYV